MPLSHEPPEASNGLTWAVLVHYGDPALTRRCLESLKAHEPHPHRVVVVNHGPRPHLEDALGDVHPDVHVVDRLDNPGFGIGCNVGADFALGQGATGLWFLNNDAQVLEPVLGRLEALAQSHPEVALWGTHQSDGPARVGADRQPGWFQGPAAAPVSLPEGCRQLNADETLSGASVYLTRDAWWKLGPWPETCFLYWEDAIWSLRAHQAHLPVVLTDLAVEHEGSATTGRRSPLSTFYGVRNMLMLHRELHPDRHTHRAFIAFHLIQKRFFQGRWPLLRPTWRAILAARRGRTHRDPRY